MRLEFEQVTKANEALSKKERECEQLAGRLEDA